MYRKFKRFNILALLVIVSIIVSACAAAAPAAPAAEKPTAEAPAAEPTVAEALTAGPLKDVSREQTLNLGTGIATDPVGTTNPWVVGYTHQHGNALMWEPLMYWAIYADKEVPWLADSMEYNADNTELTIKLNVAAAWSDGKPVTADDVVFTVESQLKNEKLNYHAAFQQYVKSAKAVDEKTAVITFNIPAPRFAFEVLMTHFDTGIPIVPAHVLSKVEDVTAYPGGLDMPHSGPYNLVFWDANQKIYDLREDWWAVAAGRMPLPAVKRVVVTNIPAQMDVTIQRTVNNEFDAILDVRSSVAKQILDSNPKITTHTGSNPPYGYLDWWPNSLWMNTLIEPFNDPNVRKAISLAIDRPKLDEILYEGAQVTTIYPFPLYPGLQKFVDLPEVKALAEKYQPGKFDLDASAKLMTDAGFTKNGNDLWEKEGKTVPATISGFEGIHSDIVPLLVEMLRTAGFDAAVDFSPEAYNHMANGDPGLYMFGHGASLKDPYAAFELFHSRYSASIGTTAGSNRFSRYNNADFDKLLDEIAPLKSDDPKFQANCVKLLELYWRDTIDIPVIQWLHRIPYNQTYWVNWPTEANPAMGINGAFWHHTAPLVIGALQPAGK